MNRRAWLSVLLLGLPSWTCSRPRDPPPVAGSTPAVGPESAPDSLLARGEAVYLRGQFDSAQGLWRTALARALATHDSIRQGRLLTWLGLAAYRQGDYARARVIGERALGLKLHVRDTGDLSRSYNALGLLAWNEGRLRDATTLFEEAVRSARAVDDQAALAKAVNNLALVHTELGDFAKARAGFLETRRSAQRLSDARIEGGALTNLGMLDVQMGAPRSALASLHAARALYRSIGYETGEQNVLGQLGTAYDALGEPGLAFAMLDSALELSRKEGLRQEEASNLELIANLHRQAGDMQRALELYGRANDLNSALGLKVEEGADLRSQAEIHAVLGRADMARESARRALEIHRAAGARLEELRDELLLADLASARGEGPAMGRHLEAAERLAAALDARTARAELALAKAAIGDRAGEGRVVLRALATGAADLAGGDYGTAWQAALLRTRAYARLGKLDSAAEAGRQAVAAVERVRGNFGSALLRASYAGDKADAYAALVDVLLRLGRTGEAFEVADAGRSRALLEHLGAAGLEDDAGRPTVRALAENEALLRRIDTLVSRLNALEETAPEERTAVMRAQVGGLAAELTAARSGYESALLRVAERDGAGSALLGNRRVSAREVQSVLGPGEVLLEYFAAPRQVIVFALSSDEIRTFGVAVTSDELSRRVRLARDLLGDPGSGGRELDPVLRGLYAVLVAPAERAGMLHDARRLIVVPHSVLAYLPFAALQREDTGRYLIEAYALEHLPSAAALVVLRQAAGRGTGRPRARRVEAFAPFPEQLPGSLREARAVGRLMPDAVVRSGDRASEQRLRQALADGKVVHVATHGIMNVRNPMFSRIELAPRPGRGFRDDGRLEVHELLGLRITAPLVFLSGCETGVGAAWSTQFARGEDYATLAQAFLYGGTGAVVATLWRIRDDGAVAISEEFYTRLRSHAPSEALADAQRSLLRHSHYSAPYYWAGYQLSGDPGTWPSRTMAPAGP